MLLGNFNQFNKNPGRALGGPSDPTLWFKAGTLRMFSLQDSSANTFSQVSFPNGYTPPYSWVPAVTGGGLSASITPTISLSNTLYGAKAMTGPLAAGGSITDANMGLIVSAIASLTAGGLITGDLVSKANMTVTIAAGGDMAGALTALGHIVAEITAGANFSATDYAIAHMTADILPYTELSPEALAAAVWNAVVASYSTTGTMGKALADAGGAGNPWGADAATNNDPGTMGEKLNKTLTTSKFLGLK